VDDLTGVTPTLVAFWLAVFDAAQVIGCAGQKKPNLAKLWWKMAEIQGSRMKLSPRGGAAYSRHPRRPSFV
jgi:hypothetical protein